MKCSRCRKKITEGKYCAKCVRNQAEDRKRNAETDYYRPCKKCDQPMINPAPNKKWCTKCKEERPMTKKKEVSVNDMTIQSFKYYKVLEGMVADENKSLNKSNRDTAGRVSGGAKLARSKAIIAIQGFIEDLLKSDEHEKLLGKELALEKEYMRVAEKQDLLIVIERATGRPAGGEYTLAEIGEVFGLTRERVRQLQSGAEKVLKHPSAGRRLREYKGDGRNYYD